MNVRLVGALLMATFVVMACGAGDGSSRADGEGEGEAGSPARSQAPNADLFTERTLTAPVTSVESQVESEIESGESEAAGPQADGHRRDESAGEQGQRGDRGRGNEPPVPPDRVRGSVSEPAVLEECRERFVIAPGDAEAVRERVPPQFELRRNGSGDPLLYVSAIRCQRYTAMGTTRATTVAAFGASIESPDGAACASQWPVAGDLSPAIIGPCSNYLFFAAYDNPEVVAWARAGTPDVPVYLVKDLVFAQEDLDLMSLGAPFHFSAGSTPSPYAMDLVVRERPVELPLTASFWFSGSAGTVRFRFETNDLAFGEASGTLRTEPGSEMARLFGTDQPAAAPVFPMLAGNRWSHGTLTKTVLPPLESSSAGRRTGQLGSR